MDLLYLTPTQLSDFTLNTYSDLLSNLSKIYQVVPFCNIPNKKEKPYLLLRHDVDFSFPAALRMAKLEQTLGIRSTYFVLCSTPLYDIFEETNSRMLKEISELGHEIGLHYYPKRYESYNESPIKTLRKEARQIENLIGHKILSISRHGGWDRDPFASTHEYINANHPFYRSYIFVHDSCRAWTTIEDLVTLMIVPQKRAQLLVHPENWQEDRISRQALVERLIQNMPELDAAIKQRLRLNWLTDSLALKYDSTMKNLRLSQNLKMNQRKTSRFKQEMQYYRRVINWHFLNCSLGWQIHNIVNVFRQSLK